jgi:PleD family two-component response regulator
MSSWETKVAFSESESHTNSLSKSELWRKMATIHTIQIEQSSTRTSSLWHSLHLCNSSLERRVGSRVVLGADNEPTVLDVTASTLEDIGCEVVTAPGGKDALKKLSTNERIEILITNINMPGMDG